MDSSNASSMTLGSHHRSLAQASNKTSGAPSFIRTPTRLQGCWINHTPTGKSLRHWISLRSLSSSPMLFHELERAAASIHSFWWSFHFPALFELCSLHQDSHKFQDNLRPPKSELWHTQIQSSSLTLVPRSPQSASAPGRTKMPR